MKILSNKEYDSLMGALAEGSLAVAETALSLDRSSDQIRGLREQLAEKDAAIELLRDKITGYAKQVDVLQNPCERVPDPDIRALFQRTDDIFDSVNFDRSVLQTLVAYLGLEVEYCEECDEVTLLKAPREKKQPKSK